MTFHPIHQELRIAKDIDLKTKPISRIEGATLVPLMILLLTGACSVVFSFAISNYVGMTLAILTFLLAFPLLKDASRTQWNWVMGLSAIGFFLGFTALIMKIVAIAAS